MCFIGTKGVKHKILDDFYRAEPAYGHCDLG